MRKIRETGDGFADAEVDTEANSVCDPRESYRSVLTLMSALPFS